MKSSGNAHAEYTGNHSSSLNSVHKVKVIESSSDKFGDVITRLLCKNNKQTAQRHKFIRTGFWVFIDTLEDFLALKGEEGKPTHYSHESQDKRRTRVGRSR